LFNIWYINAFWSIYSASDYEIKNKNNVGILKSETFMLVVVVINNGEKKLWKHKIIKSCVACLFLII